MDKKKICDLLESVMEATDECGDILFIIYNENKNIIEIAFSGTKEYIIPDEKSDIEMVYDIVKICMKHALNKKKITY